MGNTVEKDPSKIPTGYESLFELDEYAEQNEKMEIEAIILKVCDKDREIQFGRKVTNINTRFLNQDEHSAASKAKADAYLSKIGIYFEGASVIFSAAAVYFGGNALRVGVMETFSKACSGGAGYRDKMTTSEVTGHEHRYQRLNNIMSDRSQQIQAADKEHEQDSAAIDRITQSSQRMFEMIASS